MLLVLLGFGMLALGSIMFVNPIAFAKGISAFSSKSWFHTFEIVSRLAVGLLLIWQSTHSSYPVLFLVLGLILCFVSIFLVVLGPNKHKRFARLTSRIGIWFRPVGIFAVSMGGVLIYLGGTGFGG
jgi:predicted lysophospholipase L1 biosynthesis ABC-type transport system permease subunit